MKNLLKKWTAASKRTKAGIIVFAIVIVGGVTTLAGGVNAGWLRPHSLDYEITEEEDYYSEEDTSLATGEFVQDWQEGTVEENEALQTALLENGKPPISDDDINSEDAPSILFAGKVWYVIGKTDAAGQIPETSVLAAADANSLALLAKGNSDSPEDIAAALTADEAGLVIPRTTPGTGELQTVWTPSAAEQAFINSELLANAGEEPVVIWLSVEDVLFCANSSLSENSTGATKRPSHHMYPQRIDPPDELSSIAIKLTYKKDSLELGDATTTQVWTLGETLDVIDLSYSGATQGRFLAALYIRDGVISQYWTLSNNTSESADASEGWYIPGGREVLRAYSLSPYAAVTDGQVAIFVEERNDMSVDFASAPVMLALS